MKYFIICATILSVGCHPDTYFDAPLAGKAKYYASNKNHTPDRTCGSPISKSQRNHNNHQIWLQNNLNQIRGIDAFRSTALSCPADLGHTY